MLLPCCDVYCPTLRDCGYVHVRRSGEGGGGGEQDFIIWALEMHIVGNNCNQIIVIALCLGVNRVDSLVNRRLSLLTTGARAHQRRQ